MDTLNHISDRLYSRLAGNKEYNQNFLSGELLKYDIITARSQLIRRDVANHGSLHEHFWQTIPCMKLIESSEKDCKGCQESKRTEKEVPSLVRMKNTSIIPIRIHSPDHYISIPVYPAHHIRWTGSNKFTHSLPKAYRIGNYIHVQNIPYVEELSISGVYHNPRELQKFNDEDGNPIYEDDKEFPMPLDLVEDMIDKITNGELELIYSIPRNNPSEQLGRTPEQNE